VGRRVSPGLKWALVAVALVLAAAIAVPFLVPVSSFIPELTRIASEKLRQPVAIQDLKLQLVPTPRVVASGIRVGAKDDVTVGELEIVPELMSFLSGPRVVRLIRAEKVEVKESALAIAASLPRDEPGGEPVHVRRVQLKQVKLQHSKVRLPEFDAEADLAPGFQVEQARFETRDGALKLTADPQAGGGVAVRLAAKDWTLPAGAPLKFEALAVQGMLKGAQLDLPKIDGKLYGGTISADARADWTRQWQIGGKASLAGVDVVPLQQALGKKPMLSGRLKTQAAFSARAKSPEQLARALMVDGPFEVLGGAYHGVDLSKLGDFTLKQISGGSTSFEEFKGLMQVRGQAVKITQLCVRSPKLVAGGNVDIAPDQKLSGKLDVSVAKTGGFVGIPVALAGTTADPSVRPTKGYLIGAAVGTVLLPGIGTSVGSSVGSRIEGQSSCK